MKNKPIKGQIRQLFIALRKEVIKREKYFESKSDNWKEKIIGNNYQLDTQKMDELLAEIEQSAFDLEIRLPDLKQ